MSTGPHRYRPEFGTGKRAVSTGPQPYRPDLESRDPRYRPDLRRYRPEFGIRRHRDIDRTPGVIDRSSESGDPAYRPDPLVIDRSSESGDTGYRPDLTRYRPDLESGDSGYRPDLGIRDLRYRPDLTALSTGPRIRRRRLSTGPQRYRPDLPSPLPILRATPWMPPQSLALRNGRPPGTAGSRPASSGCTAPAASRASRKRSGIFRGSSARR